MTTHSPSSSTNILSNVVVVSNLAQNHCFLLTKHRRFEVIYARDKPLFAIVTEMNLHWHNGVEVGHQNYFCGIQTLLRKSRPH